MSMNVVKTYRAQTLYTRSAHTSILTGSTLNLTRIIYKYPARTTQ